MRNANTLAGALTVLLLASPASAAPTPAPEPNVLQRDAVIRQAVKIDPRAPLRARFSAISAQPRRVFRAPQSGRGLATVGTAQDVRLTAVNPDRPYTREAQYCAQHPLLVDRVTGDVTPGGTVTVRGACFGSGAGTMQMFGNFPPSGRVALVIRSWTDDTVTAQIPSVSGAPDQAVEFELDHFAPNPAARVQRRDVQNVSQRVRMGFFAQRETVIATAYIENGSCARGDHPTETQCGKAVSWPSDYFCPYTCAWADHVQSAPDSGTDTWRARLPAGWRFERVELQGAGDVVIDATLDPTNVTWSVRWRTTHVPETTKTLYGDPSSPNYKYEMPVPAWDNGAYLFSLYATGPAGTYK